MTTLRYQGNLTKRGIVYRTAERPRIQVPDFVPTTFATTINLSSGADVQATIDGLTDSTGNVRIRLQEGGSFGPFKITKVPGTGYIVVETNPIVPTLGPLPPLDPDPTVGRMTPAYATAYNLATVTYNAGVGVHTVGWNETPGSIPQRWIVRRLKVTAPTNSSVTSPLINIGYSTGIHTAATQAELPAWIAVNQCYVHGIDSSGTPLAPRGIRTGIELEGFMTRICGNWIDNIHYSSYGDDNAYDAQAIRVLLPSGPALIEFNFGEANSESIAFGGGPVLLGEGQMVMGDYTIQRNHFYRRLSWLPVAGETYTDAVNNGRRGCKNGIEMKQGRRVLWRANIIENVWCDEQHGIACLIYSIDQTQVASYLSSQDVTVEYCWFKNTFSGFQTIGTYPFPFDALKTTRCTVQHCVATGLRDASLYTGLFTGDPNIGGALTIGDVANVQYRHNTALVSDNGYSWGIETYDADVRTIDGLTLKDSILSVPNAGTSRVWTDAQQISGHGFVAGSFADLSNADWDYNLGCDPAASHHNGAHDIWVSSMAALGLTDYTRAFDLNCTLAQLSDLKPAVASPGYLSASDGTNRGADIDTVQTLLAGVRASSADLPV